MRERIVSFFKDPVFSEPKIKIKMGIPKVVLLRDLQSAISVK